MNAKIYVGDYEARATQVADTDPATVADGTNAKGNLDNTAQFAPTAPGTIRSCRAGRRGTGGRRTTSSPSRPGYGFVRFTVKDLEPGQTRNDHDPLRDELASATQGATIVGDASARTRTSET